MKYSMMSTASSSQDSSLICQNPFVKWFRHLPKLFIRFIIKSFWKSRNLFEKKFRQSRTSKNFLLGEFYYFLNFLAKGGKIPLADEKNLLTALFIVDKGGRQRTVPPFVHPVDKILLL